MSVKRLQLFWSERISAWLWKHPIVLGVSFVFINSFLFGQEISISEFLSTAKNAQELQLHQRKLDYLKNTNYKMPWADQLEFRTETDEMDFNRQEYLTRFRFNSKGERKAYEKIHGINVRIEEVEKEITLSNVLVDRYILVLDYFFVGEKIKSKKEELRTIEDKIFVIQKKGINSDDKFNLSDLLRSEKEKQEIERELIQLEFEVEYFKNILFEIGFGEIATLNCNNLITVELIIEKLNELKVVSNENAEIAKRNLRAEENEAEFNQEMIENNWNIDYLQFKYSGRDRLNFGREWAFGLGVEVPLKDANKLAKNDYMLKKIELENRKELEQVELAEKIKKIQQQIFVKNKQLELIEKQFEESQLQYSANNYPKYKDADPLVLLNINLYLINIENNKRETEKDIYFYYLELLELTGKIVEYPLKNYLSNNWELLNN